MGKAEKEMGDFSVSPQQKTSQVLTSVPDIIQRHNISDEELEMLCEGRRDFILEFLWIAIGMFVGSMPAALAAIFAYPSSTKKMPLDDLIQIILLSIGLMMTIVLGIIAWRRHERTKSLQQQIRERSPGAIGK